VRLLLRRDTAGTVQYVLLALTTAMYALCYSGIAGALAPHYTPTGELLYAGADRKTGGVLEYYFDIVYVSAFVQVLGAYTDKAWAALLLLPAYAAWLLWTHVLGPHWWNKPKAGDAPESEADRRRRDKRERQAARAEKFAYRRT
jgi:hypothetical protein